MEVSIIDDKKNRLLFEIAGVSHGFCTVLKKELLQDEHVKVATYRVLHPLTSNPQFLVETDGKEEPRAALTNAAKRLLKTSDKLKKDVVKELR
ncbi:DNA-directed RNA polymerase subunit L [Candidatus Woesearchaeota archaeon]|nr:DNA-directed RNA polymerase subunit L [Candidatus Woesearchaeota archaeon]